LKALILGSERGIIENLNCYSLLSFQVKKGALIKASPITFPRKMNKKLLLYSSPLIQVKKESSVVKASPNIFRRPVKIVKSDCSSLLSRQVKKAL
jgi:hypothetical protein